MIEAFNEALGAAALWIGAQPPFVAGVLGAVCAMVTLAPARWLAGRRSRRRLRAAEAHIDKLRYGACEVDEWVESVQRDLRKLEKRVVAVDDDAALACTIVDELRHERHSWNPALARSFVVRVDTCYGPDGFPLPVLRAVSVTVHKRVWLSPLWERGINDVVARLLPPGVMYDGVRVECPKPSDGATSYAPQHPWEASLD